MTTEIENLSARITILEERLKGRNRALKLQAKEYKRRLFDLNHAHEQAREKEKDFLPRDIYEKSEDLRYEWQRGVDTDLTVVKTRRDIYLSGFAAVVSLVSIVLWALPYFK